MKKLKNFLFCVLAVIVAFLGFIPAKVVKADASNFKIAYSDYVSEVQAILTDFCGYKTRIAGSENEKQASTYIKNYLLANATGLVAKNDSSTVDGVQNFKFLNDYTGVYNDSQNIIFDYIASETATKKVILACNYDAPLKYDAEKNEYVSFENDAVNASAAGVASMLMLAKILPQHKLDFNLEFVFFGAGENSYAGSTFYLNGLSVDDAKNVLCVINIDKIALGKSMYFYIDEISSKFSKYVSKVCSAFATEIDLVHLNKTVYESDELNLGYSHIGLDSDNVKFMKRGIATINLFAGDYNEGIVIGRNEHSGNNVLTYTENDTIEYITSVYGAEEISDNIYKVGCAVESLLSSSDFVANASNTYKNNSWFYNIFANKDLVLFLSIIAFIILIIIAMSVYYKLTIKSYYADVEVEFLSSVVKIADQIDKDATDKDVAKVIGGVLANDIKKDKTLKPGKKKKDEDKK